MEYKDYVDIMPEELVEKLNEGYGAKKIDGLPKDKYKDVSIKMFESNLSKLYNLLSKSSAYFESYKKYNVQTSVSSAQVQNNNINLRHKEIIKTLSCCNDFSCYEGYLVPRYLNMNRCYIDHYNIEVDILKTLLLLLLFKNLVETNVVCQMAMDRIEIINSLVLAK